MSRTVTRCGVCDSPDLGSVLDLGSSPPTCHMPKVGQRPATEGHHPLELLLCGNCGLVQLSVIVNAETMFPPDYPYSSGNSKGLHDNFQDLAEKASHHLTEDDLVVDIGANDGTLLSKFECRKVGVEPTFQVERARQFAPAYRAFFDEKLAEQILREHGPAKVVTACNVLAHVEDIHETMRGINALLADDGVLIAENHDLASVVNGQWDTVYHEHLRFYSPSSFEYLLDMHDLSVREWYGIPTHGGSFRTIARKGNDGIIPDPVQYDWDTLRRRALAARAGIRDAARGVWGIGATARATTLINFCGLDAEDLECVCEVSGSDKIGRYVPGTRVPIVDEDRLLAEQPETAILFSWHLAESIVPKLRERGYAGTVIVPLPSLQWL